MAYTHALHCVNIQLRCYDRELQKQMFLFLRTETSVLAFETEYSLTCFYYCWGFCPSNICHRMLPLCFILILHRPKVICVTNSEWGFCLWFDDLFPLGWPLVDKALSIKYIFQLTFLTLPLLKNVFEA